MLKMMIKIRADTKRWKESRTEAPTQTHKPNQKLAQPNRTQGRPSLTLLGAHLPRWLAGTPYQPWQVKGKVNVRALWGVEPYTAKAPPPTWQENKNEKEKTTDPRIGPTCTGSFEKMKETHGDLVFSIKQSGTLFLMVLQSVNTGNKIGIILLIDLAIGHPFKVTKQLKTLIFFFEFRIMEFGPRILEVRPAERWNPFLILDS